ncbi:MAG TPA: peptidoglycan editing factor PgeF [Rhabdochlamydiaceae bacterium]|nr:peptidoglycan editing factor PgeF [Rhabdochlamydiaceae bacterium]
MIRKKHNNIEWLEFELLQGIKDVCHGVFLRHGGISGPPFHSLNMGYTSGDDRTAVFHNRGQILQILNISKLITGKQNHGAKVEVINSKYEPLEFRDGLITQERALGLLMTHADCQAAIFYDPCHHAVANVHSGWRGNVQNIYRETILAMKEKIGTRPEDLIVCISPSLGPEASEFKNYRDELPSSFWGYQVKPTYFNLWEIARDQLEDEGVLPHHIEIASICTFTHNEDFFSYRREKITGRNATVIALR